MKMYLFALIATVLSSEVTLARPIGGHEGNGGDICENRFKTVRDDVSAWLQKGGANSLELPKGLGVREYQAKMSSAISSARISCVDQKVEVRGVPKTCVNSYSKNGEALIVCDARRFMQTSESDQYVLVHHEYAGLAGFEVTGRDGSDYEISNQLSASLVDEVVKRLAVKPASSGSKANASDFEVVKRISLVMAATQWRDNCEAGPNDYYYLDIQRRGSKGVPASRFIIRAEHFNGQMEHHYRVKTKVITQASSVTYEIHGHSIENGQTYQTRTIATVHLASPTKIASIEVKYFTYVAVPTGTILNPGHRNEWRHEPQLSFTCRAK